METVTDILINDYVLVLDSSGNITRMNISEFYYNYLKPRIIDEVLTTITEKDKEDIGVVSPFIFKDNPNWIDITTTNVFNTADYPDFIAYVTANGLDNPIPLTDFSYGCFYVEIVGSTFSFKGLDLNIPFYISNVCDNAYLDNVLNLREVSMNILAQHTHGFDSGNVGVSNSMYVDDIIFPEHYYTWEYPNSNNNGEDDNGAYGTRAISRTVDMSILGSTPKFKIELLGISINNIPITDQDITLPLVTLYTSNDIDNSSITSDSYSGNYNTYSGLFLKHYMKVR